nr:hypothetical protein [Tanacetum cinerariifolium]
MFAESGGTEGQVHDELAHGNPSAEDVTTAEVMPEPSLEKEVAVMRTPVNKRRRKRGKEVTEGNAPPKVLRKDHAAFRPAEGTIGGESPVPVGLDTGSTIFMTATQDAPTSIFRERGRDPDWKCCDHKGPKPVSARSLESGKSSSFPSVGGSPKDIYQPGWGVTKNCCLDTLKACQGMVDHIVQPRYFSELSHLPNADFLSQYNKNQARQVAMGSQLRLRFKQEVRNVEAESNSVRNQTKNLETLLEAEVSDLQAQVTEMDARLDKLSVDFDEEIYPHMLTVIAGRHWVIGHGLRLAVMMYAESSELRQSFADVVSVGLVKGISKDLKHDIEHGRAGRDLADIEAYDPEPDSKYVKAIHDLKDLKYLPVDQLEKLKDTLIDVIMASLYLESNSGEDAP